MVEIVVSLRGAARAWTATAFMAAAALAAAVACAAGLVALNYQVVAKPLPYVGAERLVMAEELRAGDSAYAGNAQVSDWLLREWLQAERRSPGKLGGFGIGRFPVADGADAWMADVASVWPDVLSIIGARADVGRLIEDGEAGANPAAVALISHDTWLQRFGGSPEVVGRALVIAGKTVHVVGVAGPQTRLPGGRRVDIWVPLRLNPLAGRVSSLSVIGSLSDSDTIEGAEESARRALDAVRSSLPDGDRTKVHLRYLREQVTAGVSSGLNATAAAGLIVLALALLNISTLNRASLLARTGSVAVRLALGARGGRLVTCEALAVSCPAMVGAVLGAVVAGLAVGAASEWLPADYPRIDEVGAGAPVIALLVCIVVAIVLASAIAGARTVVTEARRYETVSGTLRQGQQTIRRWNLQGLMAVQTVVAVVLLSNALFAWRALERAQGASLGFEPEDAFVVTMRGMPGESDVQGKALDVAESLRRIPGVEAVGVANMAPASDGEYSAIFELPGVVAGAKERTVKADEFIVTEGFLEALKCRLVEGRLPTRANGGGTRQAVVNDEMVRRHVSGEIVGRVLSDGLGSVREPVEVVGVVKSVRREGGLEVPRPQVFLMAQPFGGDIRREAAVAVRLRPGEKDVLSQVNNAVAAAQRGLVLDRIVSLSSYAARVTIAPRVVAYVGAAFATTAIAVAGLGLFALAQYALLVARRELAIRVALGATERDVRRLVWAIVVWPAVVGVGGGWAATRGLWAAGASASYGFGGPIEWRMMALAAAIVVGIALSISAHAVGRARAHMPLRDLNA